MASIEKTTDADVIRAFEAKADEVAKANGWTIARAETVMLRYLRDTSPAEAATVAAALQTRTAAAAEAIAAKSLMGRLVKVTPELTGLSGARPYLLRITRVDVVSATSGLVHVHGDKVRLDGTPSREKRPAKAATFMPGWQERLEIVDQPASR
ncbi:hypothetical protein ABT186_01975 [Streptomyces sp. NPDC001634]|uniref:hypothetical protein n=1 Tax=Streptomyces sp. NPDC001634 TaxID=3154390 RepID=UPI00331DE92B